MCKWAGTIQTHVQGLTVSWKEYTTYDFYDYQGFYDYQER